MPTLTIYHALLQACIGEVRLLGANLTETEDIYDLSASQVNWNRGPNLQVFYNCF
jgi:hypothetical protein